MKKSRRLTDNELTEFQSIRMEAGKNINPETAEIEWRYSQTMDPYGIDPVLPDEYL